MRAPEIQRIWNIETLRKEIDRLISVIFVVVDVAKLRKNSE